LAAVKSVDVVASSSSFQFKDEHVDVRTAGQALGVSFILEGSARIEDGKARVIAQLARSMDGVAVWSDSFDSELSSSLEAQKKIAQQVLANLPLLHTDGLEQNVACTPERFSPEPAVSVQTPGI
jgi:adenylate cyclase